MGLSSSTLIALRIFSPVSFVETLELFEFLKYHTNILRKNPIITKTELVTLYLDLVKSKSKKLILKDTNELFENFIKKLDATLLVKYYMEELSEIKWNDIEKLCDVLRLIERSDERKTRWALYYVFSSGKRIIPKNLLNSLLSEFQILNIDKILKKIIAKESKSGLDAKYDGKDFVISSEMNEKMIGHYLLDAIEEKLHRSPGEMEEQILNLLEEGSYSNQEIAEVFQTDESLISRAIQKLRDEDKIILHSLGKRGTKYFTTNCENCPFGTTSGSCRKDSISYITYFLNDEFGVKFTANDFDSIETNQALLKMKRIIRSAKKEQGTKLERNLNENMSKIFAKIVTKCTKYDKTSELSHAKISPMAKLPLLYQMRMIEGNNATDPVLEKIIASVSDNKEKQEIKSQLLHNRNLFLKQFDFNMD